MSASPRKVALVTGASRGIGRAVCLRLAHDGYDIVAVARDAAQLDALRAEIVAGGGVCSCIPLDLTDAAAIAIALAALDVNVLVNNAGIGIVKPFVDLAPDEWHQMIALNVNALYHVTRAVLPAMLARGEGHVCTIGSISGRSAFVGGSCYAATKAFVTAWAESLLLEVRERGVKVSVIAPGGVATGFGGKEPTASDDWKLKPEDVADAVAYVVGTPPSVLLHRVEVRTLNSPPRR
ncbi:MAG: SDR family NAD(P)-dependent oxidoreductase [Gemmatimonadota bacterium]|nr:SDR family NAD(P)-dependent oxidoreductase [Gemmatimonadota bacterium]